MINQGLALTLLNNVEKVIKGKREKIEIAILCLLAEGHLLIEDPPGVGKTMLAKALAISIGGTFNRIQFTPDLLPSDITGLSVYRPEKNGFEFYPGPVFANVVLADELNRTTPRTQSALLEALDEGKVSLEGKTHPLPRPFFLIATQNPLESHGTYPLPEGQLDRFLVSLSLGYPDEDAEKEVVAMQLIEHPINTLKPVVNLEGIIEEQKKVREVKADQSLLDYAVSIVRKTRDIPDANLGVSPRGSISLIKLAQAAAYCQERDFVLPDDIKLVAPYALSHRLFLKQTLANNNKLARDLIKDILKEVEVPIKM